MKPLLAADLDMDHKAVGLVLDKMVELDESRRTYKQKWDDLTVWIGEEATK